MLTAEDLRREFYYDRERGEFYRRFAAGGKLPWSRAGYVVSKGYRAIKIGGRQYKEHRLAWLYVHGVWPEHQIDHKNRDTASNSIGNLRDVTQSVNKQNCKMYANNKSGYRGVCWYQPSGKWLAQITRDGKRKHLGYFTDPAAAHAAYLSAGGTA